MLSPRERRRKTERQRLRDLEQQMPAVSIVHVVGDPPRSYELQLRVPGIERMERDSPVLRHEHRLRITLPDAYPAVPVQADFVTPVFHPNVFESGRVCLGDRYQFEFLDGLVRRLIEMLRYDPAVTNLNSPANRIAAAWANSHAAMLPLPVPQTKPKMIWKS